MAAQQYSLVYSPPISIAQDTTTLINASVPDSHWHDNRSSASSPSEHSVHSYSVNRSPDHLAYATLSTSFTLPQSQSSPYSASPHHSSPSDSVDHDMSSAISQVDTSVDSNRVLTRRQRALLERGDHHGELDSSRTTNPPEAVASAEQEAEGFFLSSTDTRPETPPSGSGSDAIYPSPPNNSPLDHGPDSVALRLQYTNPAGSAPDFSSFNLYSEDPPSFNTDGRVSPALTNVSAITSFPANYPLPYIDPNRPKQRKQRLFNVDRKAICVYHKLYPSARQEDIAMRYGVERSTISKILKNKLKWMNVPEHEDLRVAKHRPSKFPEVEEQLQTWLQETYTKGIIITDAMIRHKAKEAAAILCISDDKFKASSGWVENFKHRHCIRGGVWHKEEKDRLLRLENDATNHRYASPEPKKPEYHERVWTTTEHLKPFPNAKQYSAIFHKYSDIRSAQQAAWHQQRQHAASGSTDPLPPLVLPSVPQIPGFRHAYDLTPCTPPPPPQLSPLEFIRRHNFVQDSVTAYSNPEIYQAVPCVRLDEPPPSLADVENALNRVMSYIDTQGPDAATLEARQQLDHIKRAILQAGHGPSYNRSSR